MSIEPLEKIIQLWERDEITEQQAIGKILLWLRHLEIRLRQVEIVQRNADNKPQ